jgi:hypothetical protein
VSRRRRGGHPAERVGGRRHEDDAPHPVGAHRCIFPGAAARVDRGPDPSRGVPPPARSGG